MLRAHPRGVHGPQLWVWWPQERAQGTRLLDSTAHLLSSPMDPPCQPAPCSCCSPPSLLHTLVCGAGGVLVAEFLGTEPASPQWWWGQRCGVFWDVDGAVAVSLSLWAGGGLSAQPVPTRTAFSFVPIRERCVVSQEWVSTSGRASSGRGGR